MIPRIPVREPSEYETFAATAMGADGAPSTLAATLLPDQPGMEGYLVPFNTLSDRGTFFVRGAFKKTAREQLSTAHHLLYHWPDLIIGKHTAAVEDDRGFRVTVLVNEELELARDVMSNYRFGIGYGWSVGFDPIRDRSGTDDDDARLDRSGVPHLANVPINELRAITEARWYEGSTVPWGALYSARPDTVHALGADADSVAALLTALQAGTLTTEQTALAEQIVETWTSRAAAGTDHGTRDPDPIVDRRAPVAAALARYAGFLEREIAA